LGVWRLTPSHSPTLPGVSDVTPGLPLGPHPCNPFALVASPKLGLRQSPKVEVALGMWGITPSHFLTLSGVCDVTPGLPLGLHSCNPFTLVASPKLGLRQWSYVHLAKLLTTWYYASFSCFGFWDRLKLGSFAFDTYTWDSSFHL